MTILFRRLTEADLDTFIKMRVLQLTEEYETTGRAVPEDIDLKPSLRDYYRRHMADDTFVSWVAVDKDRIVGTSGMSFC